MSKLNWIVVVARNNLDLLRQAVRSFEAQDIGNVAVLCVNNGSTDATASWLHSRPDITSLHFNPQHSVARAWNSALRYLFTFGGTRFVERVLVCNSDVVLRPDTWRLLEAEEADFVTAVGVHTRGQLGEPGVVPDPKARRPHPDFSCFMISRWCYEQVGPFDEEFRGAFCEDSDYHCRMHKAGVGAYSIGLPFLHVGGGSQTYKRADETEKKRIAEQAGANRRYFKRKWGFEVPDSVNGGADYYGFFGSEPPERSPRV